MCNTLSLSFARDGEISVADRMPLSSVVKTVKINGGVECRWCMKTRNSQRVSGRSLLDGHVWSPCGRFIIAYRTWADDRDDRVRAVNNIHWWMAWAHISAQLCITQKNAIFIAPQHTDTRYWYSKSACLSVRLSVCPSWRSGIRWKRLNIILS